MVQAWRLQENNNAAILFIIESVTYNICDQRFHEFEIRRKYPEIQVLRLTLTDVHNQGKLGPSNELLMYVECNLLLIKWFPFDLFTYSRFSNGIEVSVVYFRAGYEPGHYPTQNEWDARYLIEISKAIKCPSIHYHLAGTKKVQQALAKPGMLNRFLTDDTKIKSIQDIFTGLYSLDSNTEEGQNAFKMALINPSKYVPIQIQIKSKASISAYKFEYNFFFFVDLF